MNKNRNTLALLLALGISFSNSGLFAAGDVSPICISAILKLNAERNADSKAGEGLARLASIVSRLEGRTQNSTIVAEIVSGLGKPEQYTDMAAYYSPFNAGIEYETKDMKTPEAGWSIIGVSNQGMGDQSLIGGRYVFTTKPEFIVAGESQELDGTLKVMVTDVNVDPQDTSKGLSSRFGQVMIGVAKAVEQRVNEAKLQDIRKVRTVVGPVDNQELREMMPSLGFRRFAPRPGELSEFWDYYQRFRDVSPPSKPLLIRLLETPKATLAHEYDAWKSAFLQTHYVLELDIPASGRDRSENPAKPFWTPVEHGLLHAANSDREPTTVTRPNGRSDIEIPASSRVETQKAASKERDYLDYFLGRHPLYEEVRSMLARPADTTWRHSGDFTFYINFRLGEIPGALIVDINTGATRLTLFSAHYNSADNYAMFPKDYERRLIAELKTRAERKLADGTTDSEAMRAVIKFLETEAAGTDLAQTYLKTDRMTVDFLKAFQSLMDAPR